MQKKMNYPNSANIKTGKGCLYIKQFKDIQPVVFRKMLLKAYHSAKQE